MAGKPVAITSFLSSTICRAMEMLAEGIAQGDCVEVMRQMPSSCIDLVFADPPFNIGYDYDEYHDRHSDDEYLDWSRNWMEEVHRILKPNGTFWLAIGDEYAADLKVIADRQIGFTMRSWVIWYYTFGVNCRRKFNRSHAHLFHFVKDPDEFTFNFDDPELRVPSARALVYGDKRANPKGRLPDDTWVYRPQDFQTDKYGFSPADDTWYFARVAGTFKERQGFHGCQMPEQLLARIVRASSNEGDWVFDPFVGSGTTLAVSKKLGRRWYGSEMSTDYVRYSSERLDGIASGDALDGPADPIASAPATGNGRKLATWEDVAAPVETVAAAPPAEEVVVDVAPAPVEVKVVKEPVSLRDLQLQVLNDAYLSSCDGYSVDRLLADPQLQARFETACREAGLFGEPAHWNHELLRLRKAGKLAKPANPQTVTLGSKEFDTYKFAGEIAWRHVNDKHPEVSIDEIFCRPELAQLFDRTAAKFCPGRAAVDFRWAALYLRKSRHTLAAEAKEYDYVFRTRNFGEALKLGPRLAQRWEGQGGVYLLLGARRAPLFVGDTLDLGQRLALHVAAAGSKAKVTQVAVITDAELPSSDYREALKHDLAQRCKSAWNVT